MADTKEPEKEQLPEAEKLLDEGSAPAIKFVSAADSCTNGDAKIDLGTGMMASTGLKKEELMKFANDPFWVRLRWLLFILFWVTWLLMLVGAIYIVVMAPKCPAPEPRVWWEKGQLITVDGSQDGGLKALTEKLSDLKESTAGILLDNVISADNYGIIDFKDVDDKAGSLDDFKLLTSKAKTHGIRIILGIEINHVSTQHPWFLSSTANKTGSYGDFFVWKDGKAERGSDGKPNLPNNWLSVKSGPAWEYSSTRKQYYLHQFLKQQADLNLKNEKVQMEIRKALRFWRGVGVDGYLFKDASYLVEDGDLRDDVESGQPSDKTFKDYEFFNHIYTKNMAANVEILNVFKNEMVSDMDDREGKIVFAADIEGSVSEVVQYYGTERPPVIELPLNHLAKADSASDIAEAVAQWRKVAPADMWPNWYTMADSGTHKAGLAMALNFLPGTFIYQPQAKFFETMNTSDVFNVMKATKSQRETPSVMFGELETMVLEKDVFGFTRKKSGNPGYMILFNSASEERLVNVTGFPDVPESLTLILSSSEPGNDLKNKVESESVPVAAGSTVVLTFVPRKH